MNEEQYGTAIKQLETAMQIHRAQPEYNMAMGECKMQLREYKEAIQFFSVVVRQRPKNISSWEALIRCLYAGKYFQEAHEQVKAAMKHTDNKPVFVFYFSAILFALKKSKEAMLQLEKGMNLYPKGLKKFIDLNPEVLQSKQVSELLSRYKKTKQ